MGRTRRYEMDGMTIEIPLRYDRLSRRYLEIYDELIDAPKRTPRGFPIITVAQVSCQFAPQGVRDCSACPHYKPAGKHTWFGSCRNELNRVPPEEGGK